MNRRITFVFSSTIVCLSISAASFAATIRVDFRQIQNTPTGGSWAYAFPNPIGALAIAEGGDTVVVAQGIYRPAGTNGDRNASFVLKNGVILEGGYKGLSDLENSDTRVDDPSLTILSGDLNDNDDDGENLHHTNRSENSYIVVRAGDVENPVDDSTFLRNFTIRDGHNFSGPHNGNAAGIWVPNGSYPKIQNCVIKRNAVPNSGWGAGIFIETQDPFLLKTTRITDVFMTENESGEGGALMAWDYSKIRLERCTMYNNRSTGGGGGGFSLYNHVDATMIECIVEYNLWDRAQQVGEGGGGRIREHSTLLMKNSGVWGNQITGYRATSYGGGL